MVLEKKRLRISLDPFVLDQLPDVRRQRKRSHVLLKNRVRVARPERPPPGIDERPRVQVDAIRGRRAHSAREGLERAADIDDVGVGDGRDGDPVAPLVLGLEAGVLGGLEEKGEEVAVLVGADAWK
jgi:hypothetical protein